MGKPKVDWSRLCSEYVTASQPVTLTDLAAANGIARETVSRKATKEQWDVKRERYLMRVEEQTTEKKAEKVASAGADFDTASLDFANRGMELAQKFLESQDLDPRVMKDVMTAGRTAQQIAKDALGDKPEQKVTVDGKVSLEQVIADYISVLPPENGTGE
jgi:hypothetical protein